jgi:regulator of sigma E protease
MPFYLAFILILIGLIIVHEFGHFIVAKLFGIKVDEFGVGFPPRLFGRRFGETDYTFNALLLGGFVRIHGENNEAANDPRSFAAKPRLVQAAVVVAGVAFNVLFAWLVFSGGYMAGLPASTSHTGFGEVSNAVPTILGVLPQSPAQLAGLAAEDVVLGVETGTGERTSAAPNAQEIRAFITAHENESLLFTVQRNAEVQVFLARAEEGVVEGRKAVGIEIDDFGVLQLPPHTALVQGAVQTYRTTAAVAVSLGGFFFSIVQGGADFSQVAGPIGIVSFGAQAVGSGAIETLLLTALISINLAIINLLPIPGLDGGRLVIIVAEGLSGRRVPERLTTALTLAGFALLILLMVVVSFYDIARLTG